jgi:hypothetical protein
MTAKGLTGVPQEKRKLQNIYVYLQIHFVRQRTHVLCLFNICFFGLSAYLRVKTVRCRVGDQSEREIVNLRRISCKLSPFFVQL